MLQAAYFLTQITRTTDAFGSGGPFAATTTPLAFKNSRTVSAFTREACAAAAVIVGPATTTGFSSATPAKTPSASSAALPENPSPGAGVSHASLPACALTLLTAAPPP